MNTPDPFRILGGAAPADSAGPADDPVQAVLDAAERVGVECAQRFDSLLPRIMARLAPDEDEARRAIESGGAVVRGHTVVVQLNPETDAIEFFCDIGLPDAASREAAYRHLLELNLCRIHPGLTFGVHPDSARLVVTTAMHVLLVGEDEEVCLQAIERLVGVAQEVRGDGTWRAVQE